MLSELDMGPVISRRRGGGAASIQEDNIRTMGQGFGFGSVPARVMLSLNENHPGEGQENETSTEGGPDQAQNNQMQVRLLVLRERLHQAMYN